MKYKVGDTLRHHKCFSDTCEHYGKTFVVTGITDYDMYVGDDGVKYCEWQVELVEEAQ